MDTVHLIHDHDGVPWSDDFRVELRRFGE